jgi:hypothetical protein
MRLPIPGCALLTIVVVACGGPPAVGLASQSRQLSPAPSPLTNALCNLPIANVGETSGEVYFVAVPTGVMTTPTIAFEGVPASGALWGLRRTVTEPVLYGQGDDAAYDWPFHRWIPARSSAISPDGTQYAYAGRGSGESAAIHIVNVTTGQDRVAASGDNFWPLVFNNDGVYLTQRSGAGFWAGGGLFLLDPATGSVRQVHAPGAYEGWQFINGNFAYGSDANPADPSPAGRGEGATDELIRLDMTIGVIEHLLYQPGQGIGFIGLTVDGRTMASLSGGFSLVDSQGHTTLIMDAPAGAFTFTDNSHTWFLTWNSPRHLYRLSGNSAEHVMDFQAYTNPNDYMSLAGGCY